MSLISLIKNWTLPLSMLIGSSIYFLFANVKMLSPAALLLEPFCKSLLPSIMFCILYVTFCKVNFRKLKLVKWHYGICLVQILIIATLVGIILALPLSIDNKILLQSGLSCIVAPTAAAAAVVSPKLGGNIEEMTTYTFLSNLITAIIIPVTFPLVESSVQISFFEAFTMILYKVFIVLQVPMLLAFITKRLKFLYRFRTYLINIKDLSFYMWAILLMVVTGITVKNIVHIHISPLTLLSIALFSLAICLFQFRLGRWVGKYYDSIADSGQALGQKNSTFAIWISATYLHPLAAVGPGFYILWQNIINSYQIWTYNRSLK